MVKGQVRHVFFLKDFLDQWEFHLIRQYNFQCQGPFFSGIFSCWSSDAGCIFGTFAAVGSKGSEEGNPGDRLGLCRRQRQRSFSRPG